MLSRGETNGTIYEWEMQTVVKPKIFADCAGSIDLYKIQLEMKTYCPIKRYIKGLLWKMKFANY